MHQRKKNSEAEIQEFYANLKEAHALADDKLLVLGDFNAKIAQPRREISSWENMELERETKEGMRLRRTAFHTNYEVLIFRND